MHLLGQAIWTYIWKRTEETSPTNANNSNLPALIQVLWGNIWKDTVEKNPTNAILCVLSCKQFEETFEITQWRKVKQMQTLQCIVTMHPLKQAIWGHIWKHTLETNRTNATNATMRRLIQSIWGNIWKHTHRRFNISRGQTILCMVLIPRETSGWYGCSSRDVRLVWFSSSRDVGVVWF